MYRPSYDFADFNTFKDVNETSHFTNNLYFGHNERRFHSEFNSRVKFDPNLRDYKSTFHSVSSVESGMKNGMNSIRNELKHDPDSCKQIHVKTPLVSEIISTKTPPKIHDVTTG